MARGRNRLIQHRRRRAAATNPSRSGRSDRLIVEGDDRRDGDLVRAHEADVARHVNGRAVAGRAAKALEALEGAVRREAVRELRAAEQVVGPRLEALDLVVVDVVGQRAGVVRLQAGHSDLRVSAVLERAQVVQNDREICRVPVDKVLA